MTRPTPASRVTSQTGTCLPVCTHPIPQSPFPCHPLGPNPSLPESCDYFRASCDDQLQYCLLDCLGPCVPYTVLASYDQAGERLEILQVMEGNPTLRDAVSSLALPVSQTFSVPADGMCRSYVICFRCVFLLQVVLWVLLCLLLVSN